MKKNLMLGALVAAVAITSYSVSGTYAKYTSQIDITDEARVAKWEFKALNNDGSVVSGDVDLFADSYYLDDATKLYVKSLNGDSVVAPGTKGTYTFKLSGDMEVRYGLSFDVNVDNDFVVYYNVDENGVVTDMNKDKTQLADTDNVKEYRPLRYTVKYTRGTDNTDLTNGKLVNLDADQLQTALNAYSAAHPEGFAPGAMNQNYEITWSWDTQTIVTGLKDTDEVDKLDTYAGENLSTDKVKLGVKITATQIAEDYSSVNGRLS